MPSAALSPGRFGGYVACSANGAPSHHCVGGAFAVFVDRRQSHSAIRQCILQTDTPEASRSFCSALHTGRAGHPVRRALPIRAIGRFTVTWFHHHVRVAQWGVAITEGTCAPLPCPGALRRSVRGP